MRNGFCVTVEFVHQRNAGRDVELEDLFLRKVIEVHDERAEAVPVGDDDQPLTLLHAGENRRFPVRENALERVLQALAVGGRDVKTAAPYLDLRIPEFLRRLRLVEPLQVAVMPLVQRLVIVDGDRLLPGDVEDDVERVVGPLENRSECVIEFVLLQLFTCGLRLFDPFLGKGNVDPAGEAVFKVPL